MSDTMTEGVLAKWHKKVGDKVKSGDVLAEVETDKATMDFESYQDGTLLYIGVEEGKAVPEPDSRLQQRQSNFMPRSKLKGQVSRPN